MKFNNTYLIIIGAILLLGIFIAGQQFAITGTGYSVLSIDKPNVESADDDLSQLNWIVTTRLGGADQVKFTLDDEFERETGLGSEKPFIVEADSLDEILKYRINAKDDYYFKTYQVRQVQEQGANENPEAACPNADYIITYDASILNQDRAICIDETRIGRYGELSNPTRKIQTDLTISNGETEITRTIGSDQTSAEFTKNGELISTATWQGNLMTGNPDPTVPDTGVLGDFTNDRWRFISEANFDSYKNAQEDFVREIETVDSYEDTFGKQIFDILLPSSVEYDEDDFLRLANEIENEAENVNQNVDTYLKDYEFIDTSFDIANANSEQEAYLEFESDVQLSFPVITFYIRADYLGVERLVGEPDILEASSREFGSMEQGTVNLRVENEGNTVGYFNAYLKNCDSFTTTTTANQFTVNPNDIRTYSLRVDPGSQDRDIEETCNVCVNDVNRPSIEDCRDTTLKFKATTICTPNEYSINDNNIVQCKSDGSDFEIIERCGVKDAKYTGEGPYDGYECIRDTTLSECEDTIDNDNDGKIDLEDPDCASKQDDSEEEQVKECAPWDLECNLKQFGTTALPFVALLLGLGMAVWSGYLLRKRFDERRQLFFVIMVSIGIGILTYFLFKAYWWAFLIIALGLAIWQGFVGGKVRTARRMIRR